PSAFAARRLDFRDGARLAAAFEHGDDLAGVAKARGVDGRAHAQHRAERVVVEDERQVFALVQANAVLARDRPARAHAGLHDLAPGEFDARHLFRVARVEADERVQVSVARVEDVGDAQAVLRADAVGGGENFGQARARHDRVLYEYVGRD